MICKSIKLLSDVRVQGVKLSKPLQDRLLCRHGRSLDSHGVKPDIVDDIRFRNRDLNRCRWLLLWDNGRFLGRGTLLFLLVGRFAGDTLLLELCPFFRWNVVRE